MRDDRQRLTDILEAAKLLQIFQGGRTRDDLNKDLLLRSACLHQLFVIREAATRLSQQLKDKYLAVLGERPAASATSSRMNTSR